MVTYLFYATVNISFKIPPEIRQLISPIEIDKIISTVTYLTLCGITFEEFDSKNFLY